MSYSEYSHFSDKISYKILFIPSYRLKDMNITSFKHFLKKTEGRLKLFIPRRIPAQAADCGPEALTGC
jgi:hypothetical protein